MVVCRLHYLFVPTGNTLRLHVAAQTLICFQLGYEGRKAKKIIASRDISYAFTNVMTHNYYSLRKLQGFSFVSVPD